MSLKLRAGQKGFTLIELLVVVAIIGIIAAMLIPNLLDAMQKAKQKRTIADMRITGTALFSWLTDQVGAAAAGASTTNSIDLGNYGGVKYAEDLRTVLIPLYLQDVPRLDGWKKPYEYYLKTTAPLDPQVTAIRSLGRNQSADGGPTYTVTAFESTDYDQDILWADGFFIRWPAKVKVD
jgi:prepilin-type N-terminal cleavage/methylation domain-containing protein